MSGGRLNSMNIIYLGALFMFPASHATTFVLYINELARVFMIPLNRSSTRHMPHVIGGAAQCPRPHARNMPS